MISNILITALLVGLAGVCNGIIDTLQFHYEQSFARKWNAEYWNPDISWINKYKLDKKGNLIRPLQARFWGSTTFLVLLTDAWHLFKFLQYAFLRVLLVWLAWLLLEPSSWWYAPIIYFTLWGIQATGFHLFYTILKK